ncbi:MAG: glutamine--fructose-6-phosphate transaminase (isomerizing) [Nitrospiraceae bacterium]|nr:glutamine--fructose-6-phosphate transaminase (isomerizing) [Nitrospiraceae bacterium]
MCGIIGYTGPKNAVAVVIEGLKRLEYRGYDSAGVAFAQKGKIKTVRSVGKIGRLEDILGDRQQYRKSGAVIGHTRWATHGGPSKRNAHPHKSGSIAVVHNGIIENYLPLKKKLKDAGYEFLSDTDTEVICHLINHRLREFHFEDAVRAAVGELKGAYALAIINGEEPEKIIGVRRDSPLVLGVGEGEFFLCSDASAFLAHTKKAVFLEDGEMAVITRGGYKVMRTDGKASGVKIPQSLPWSESMAEKNGYKHFMLKEIDEQPRAVADTIRGRILPGGDGINLEEFGLSDKGLKKIEKVLIVACGTSWHAGLAGRFMMEQMARMPAEVDIASEFKYRRPILKGNELFISISQSGETADTLAAQRLAKKAGLQTLAITNVVGSTAQREADAVFFTRSGPEIGVASTKTFTAQLCALYMLAVAVARAKGTIDRRTSKRLIQDLVELPGKIEDILNRKAEMEKIARRHFKKEHFLFLGRGISYPIALEGALKLKEISYIHAEGYPAGEMKHGPIALIDEEMPALFLLPLKSQFMEKIISNMQEVRSRNARVLLVTDGLVTDGQGPAANDEKPAVTGKESLTREQDGEFEAFPAEGVFRVPDANEFLLAALMAVPLQLLAYYIGVLRGCDVDQPRNLAKSVTVE